MWSVIKSVLAALIGVQSDRKRREDFSHKHPAMFIIAFIIITLLFVMVLWGLAFFIAG
ncbi:MULTISPECIES: DUF2970 domain-containing protein [unclassified Halomonas]|uniref:DUF2970 domain-containing protein n=1 Tax=unclassified Halomonas TaxID=2609666 RepID=UPI0007F078F9|nr:MULTISPECIES: DUF2970 domain-containing protein [unclassified Halomonas]SBR48599.1 Protein of unknown function (DUF2970) [Halomonas sp. HL-93]SNY96210.1 Protein of unknown function [Halomonas sp. hl-4]